MRIWLPASTTINQYIRIWVCSGGAREFNNGQWSTTPVPHNPLKAVLIHIGLQESKLDNACLLLLEFCRTLSTYLDMTTKYMLHLILQIQSNPTSSPNLCDAGDRLGLLSVAPTC